MSPFISFLLPAYKVQHLGESIESILSQTYTNFELVIVNDCSPDDIDKIVNSFPDNRIRYYKNKENIGQKDLVKQWNHCLSLAEGEWIVMASDDDLYHPYYLQEMINLSKSYPNNNVFHCNIVLIDDDNNITDISPQISIHESTLQNTYYRLTYRRIEALPDYFIRAKVLKEIGGFINFPMATGSDTATCITVAGKNGIICSSKYLFKWRYNGKNISSNPHTCLDRIEACEKIYEWAQSFYESLNDCEDEISEWIKKRFVNDVRISMAGSEAQLINNMPISDINYLLGLERWPYSLINRNLVVRNRRLRNKKKIKQLIKNLIKRNKQTSK